LSPVTSIPPGAQIAVRAALSQAPWKSQAKIRKSYRFSVANNKSTHAGNPWLRYIRERLGKRIHFWPFDGWDIPARALGHRRSLSGAVEPQLR
jgi:hypothetical protein